MNRITSNHKGVAASTEALSSSSVIIQTMSGYEIWLDPVSQPEYTDSAGLVYRFPVTSPDRHFHIVRVVISPEAQDAARHASGPRFSDDERFWFTLAYNALADELDESIACFCDDGLEVNDLNAAYLDLARQWTDRVHKEVRE